MSKVGLQSIHDNQNDKQYEDYTIIIDNVDEKASLERLTEGFRDKKMLTDI